MRFAKFLFVCALISLIAVGCSKRDARPATPTRELTLDVEGFILPATLYIVDKPSPPGLILVPMLGTTRERWLPFAQAAQAEGYMCLAFNLRGHADAKDGLNSYKSFKPEDWQRAINDIAVAKQALLDAGVNPENIGIVGASIGANMALRYAVDDFDIQAVALISPGKEYQGLTVEDAITKMNTRPILLMSSIGDSYSSDTCNALEKLAPGHCELHEYAGTAHGTDLLDSNEQVAGQALEWLSAIIGPKSQASKP